MVPVSAFSSKEKYFERELERRRAEGRRLRRGILRT
jgi:hypothetical protein